MARPQKYTQAIGKRICKEIANGKTTSAVAAMDGMPHRSQIYRWLSMPRLVSFRDMFEAAIVQRADAWAEESIDIADDSLIDTWEDDDGVVHINRDVIQRSKLRVETRLKLMGKVNPRKYGPKVGELFNDEGDEVQPLLLFSMRPIDVEQAKNEDKSKS